MKLLRLSGVGVIVGSLVCGLACAGDGTGVDLGNGNGGGGVSLSADVQPIFTSNCALSGCHAGAAPVQGMNLSLGQAFSNIVNVPSNESSLLRVTPGDPDASYLVHKIQGTQSTVGGSGARMPLGGQLSAGEIETIRSWITAGAENN